MLSNYTPNSGRYTLFVLLFLCLLFFSIQYLTAQVQQAPEPAEDVLVGFDCFKSARQQALDDNLTVAEMLALCERYEGTEWLTIANQHHYVALVAGKSYRSLYEDGLLIGKTDLNQRLNTEIPAQEVRKWRNSNKYVVWYQGRVLNRNEINGLILNHLRIRDQREIWRDDINRRENKLHIYLQTVEEIERDLASIDYFLEELENN
ncbi:MAG: hypothetical protein AAGF87_15650 [Bacteroidota bacterium]